jgi:cytochrome c oxidase subunit 2
MTGRLQVRAQARAALAVLALTALGGCQGWQSALDPQGPQARELAWLFWMFLAVLTAIFFAVMIALALALIPRGPPRDDPLAVDPASERRKNVVVAGLAVATGVTVLVLTGFSYVSQRNLFRVEEEAVIVRVTGHQWWWEVRYEEPDASRTFTTANEIHVPVGKPVKVKLNSADVIHSFWLPNLMGKQDLIPGQENDLRFVAERPGLYRGQCAEFCGLQHARMGLLVVAEEEAAFNRWRDAQIAPAETPTEPERITGLKAFLSRPCVMCHTVRGTDAGGKVAPDLTHVGSRKHLAASTLPMSRGNLAAWIVDPHGIKPGVNMPTIKLDPDDINAIAAYLEGLK